MPIDGVSGARPVGGTPVPLTPPKVEAAVKRKASAGDPIVPLPIPDGPPPTIPETRFVSVPRGEIQATFDRATGQIEFHKVVNGRTLKIPPGGLLA